MNEHMTAKREAIHAQLWQALDSLTADRRRHAVTRRTRNIETLVLFLRWAFLVALAVYLLWMVS